MKILIVEDDRDAAEYLVKAFREAGHTSMPAQDGLTGYGMAEEGCYDVLVSTACCRRCTGLSLIAACASRGTIHRS